ncbi:MAG: DNA polymerase domain-containing protein [Candidatus Kariarchaeaceae archaeon]
MSSRYQSQKKLENGDYPWSCVPIINELLEGMVLDGYYSDDVEAKFHLLIYDPQKKQLVRWIDTRITKTNPYIYHQNKFRTVDQIYETSFKTDLLFDKQYDTVELTDYEASAVFSNEYDRAKNKFGSPLPTQLMYFHKTGVIPGSWVTINDNQLSQISKYNNEEINNKIEQIRKLLLGDSKIIVDLCVENMPIMEDLICDIRRIGIDIEVASPRDTFPIPEEARYPINSISSTDSDGKAIIWLLSYVPTKKEIEVIINRLGYEPDIRTFVMETELIKSFFNEIADYPVVLTYNGDNFDLPYLHHRALRLGMESPIVKGRYLFYREEMQFRHSIHVDLFRFLSNNAIRLYAFGGKYSRSRLMDVGEALVGRKKIEHDLWFDEMTREDMIVYNIRDAELTLQLTTFNNGITWKLLIILMRVGRMSLSYVNRAPISKWILNWIVAEHEKRDLILPKKNDLLKEKGSFESNAQIDGKNFHGAIVLDPKPGVFWDVSVVDFNSLYPSTIKNYNLSYETMRCDHKSCESNLVPDLDHWVCRKRIGIMSSLVGFVREIRVRYYKGLSNSEDQDERELGNTMQAALKVFINASYGVFGAPNFYLYCPPVAESTTAISRSMLMKAKSLAEEMGLTVLGGDTDSIFVHKISKDQMAQLTEWSVIDLGIELGLDYTFRFMVLSNRKKNYFGITTDNKIIIKGLAIKKSNTAQFIKCTFDLVADELKKVKNEKELENAKNFMIKLIYEKLKMLKDEKIPLEDLQHMVSLNKKFNEYFAKTPAVQLALQEMDENNEHQITRGTQYMTVKVKPFSIEIQTSRFINFQKFHHVECAYKQTKDVIGYNEVNIKHYGEAMKKAFLPIFDAFDLNYNEVVLNRNQSLKDSFGTDTDDMMDDPVNVVVVGTEISDEFVTLVDGKIEDYGF